MSSIHIHFRTITLSTVLMLGLVGCGGGGGGSGNNSPPPAATPPPPTTISLDIASTGSVNRTVPLTASVTTPTGVTVTSVEFLVDGTVVGTATAAPYTVNWDTSTVADGSHSVTSRVADSAARTTTSTAVAVTVTNNPVIHVELSNDQVLPAIDSDATAEGDVTVNLATGAVSGGVTIQGLTATLAHIHRGYAGVNGPVVVDFAADPSNPARWNAVAGGMLSAEDVDNLLAGALYVNVHSAAFPAGEIRGQLQPENIRVVFSPMSNEQVVPAAPDAASGTIAATVDSAASTATIHAITSALVEPTEAHVHNAAEGETASDALFALTRLQSDPNHWAAEQQTVTSAQVDAFDSNLWYVDVHTTGVPAGAVRGQIIAEAPAPPPPPPPPPAATTLAELQATIFGPRCAGCHNGVGAALPGVMNLSTATASFSVLVGVTSSEQPPLLRVAPGDSANSYLVHKLEGAPSISGSRMPLGGPFLDAALITQVRSWIDAGAANN
jgi:hypothetical protein